MILITIISNTIQSYISIIEEQVIVIISSGKVELDIIKGASLEPTSPYSLKGEIDTR